MKYWKKLPHHKLQSRIEKPLKKMLTLKMTPLWAIRLRNLMTKFFTAMPHF